MKVYYYWVLFKIYFRKGAKAMIRFLRNFIIGFVIGFTIVAWGCTTFKNAKMVSIEYVESYNV